MKAAEILDALEEKLFPFPEYVFMREVSPSTGFSGARIDGIALGMWPSRGLHLHGFEVKISRGDYLREIRNPAKAEALAEYCDSFSIVTPKGVAIVGDELPEPWGHYEVKKTEKGVRVFTTKKPELLPSRTAGLPRGFVCSIVRSASSHKDPTIKRQLQEARKTAYDSGMSAAINKGKRAEAELAELRKALEEIKAATSFDLVNDWRRADNIAALKVAAASTAVESFAWRLEQTKTGLEKMVGDLDTVLSTWKTGESGK